MTTSDEMNIFLKTTYLQSEEDRVTNALFAVLLHTQNGLTSHILQRLGIILPKAPSLSIREHVYYDSHNIVDGEITCGDLFTVALEIKIYKGQFETGDQIGDYFRLLCQKKARKKLLVLVSTDDRQPTVVDDIPGQTSDSTILWFHWNKVCSWIQDYQKTVCQHPIDQFLTAQLLDYLEALGLTPAAYQESGCTRLRPQLKDIFGNATAEKVLLHVFHFQGAHASKIARDHNVDLYAVQKQIVRFERSGVLRKEKQGRTVMYYFNDKNPFFNPILQLVQIVYDSIPLSEKVRVFSPAFEKKRK